MVKDVLLFQSDSFSLDASRNSNGDRFDLPLGDDICAFFKEQLEARKVNWAIDAPVQEDIGTVLMLCRERTVFTITTSWQGNNSWALVFGQMRGCLGWALNRKPDAEASKSIEAIKLLVDEVVRSDTNRFQNATWIDYSEFSGVGQHFLIR